MQKPDGILTPNIERGHMPPLRTHYIRTTANSQAMEPTVAESATGAQTAAGGQFPGALFRSNQIASFEYAEQRETFATKVRDCVLRAFQAIGTSLSMQDVIIWNLSVTKKVGLDEVADKPGEFIEGMHAIFGETGADVFEHMLIREIKREFGLADDKRLAELKGLPEVLQFVGFLQ